MNFANPYVLYLLPLVAVPVLIHLLGKKARYRVKFPWVELLKKASTEGKRRRKPFEILLLVLRTLLLLLLILAFSNPVNIGDIKDISAVWIDVSHSMSPYQKQEKEFVRTIKNILPAVKVKYFASRPIEISAPEKTYFSTSLKGVSGNSFIFSDLQKSMLKGASIDGRVLVVRPDLTPLNRAIVEFSSDAVFAVPGAQIPFTLKVANYSNEPWSGKIEIFNGDLKAKGWGAYLKPWEVIDYRDTLRIGNSGLIKARLTPGDLMDGDDERFLYVPFVSRARVILNCPNRYVSAALKPVGINTPFELSDANSRNLSLNFAQNADVVFFIGPLKPLELNIADVLASSGKGAVLFVGDSLSASLVSKKFNIEIKHVGSSQLGEYKFYDLWEVKGGIPILKDDTGHNIAVYLKNMVICGFLPMPDNTDFIYSPEFAPFINRATLISLHKTSVYYVTPDTVLKVPVFSDQNLVLKAPDGKEMPLSVYRVGNESFTTLGPFDTVGVFGLFNNSGKIAVIVVNLDSEESDVAPASGDELNAVFRNYRLINYGNGEWWSLKKVLLWLALLVFIAEFAVLIFMKVKGL